MSTASDVARVFTDTEEETYSMFSKPEQAMLSKGKVNRTIIEKILDMKFYNYQYEAMFRFFEAFLCTLRGWGLTPDTSRQFRLLKRFASDTNYDYYMEDKALKEKQEAVEVTPSGHIFKGDDLIAL